MTLDMIDSRNFERSGTSRGASNFFSLSLPFLRSKAQTEAAKPKTSLSTVKLKVELCFQDIDSDTAERLRYKIRGSREVKDLWMLRIDIHQMISRHISQDEAAKRINALLPYFEHWIAAKELTKI